MEWWFFAEFFGPIRERVTISRELYGNAHMTDLFASLSEEHIEFIGRQSLFFVGTAAVEGRINVSPKGLDTLRVIDAGKIVWLNLTGSGNETAAHVLENSRMTLMFCSFDKQPLILRVYGQAEMVYPRDETKFDQYSTLFGQQPGTRQFFELDIELVQTSCGFGVPRFELEGERPTLSKWATGRGEVGIHQYWSDKNQISIDGKPTGING